MAITKTQKIPRGFDVQATRLRELGDGIAPPIPAFPAYYLPLVIEDEVHELWKVVEAGQIVAFDQTSLNAAHDNSHWLVPANGNTAQTVTYAAIDVTENVPDIDIYQSSSATTAVAAAGAASTSIAANFPAGFAPYDYYTKSMELRYHNTFPQPNVTFLTRGLIELPLIYDSADGAVGTTNRVTSNPGNNQATAGDSIAVDDGRLVMSGTGGWIVAWDTDNDSVEQICGRCVQRVTIAVEDALDKVHTVPGLSLPGTGTSGKQLHETYDLLGTTTDVVSKARINITLL